MAARKHKRPYGTGAITKLGARWRIRWRERGRRCSAMFSSRRDAEAALAARLMKLARSLSP